jgi:hypothetical protein
MTTKTLAVALSADGNTASVQVEGGQYLIAVNGTFGGGTLQLKANIGPVAGVPITGAAYTAEGAEVVWLPACTVFFTLSGATTPSVNAAIAELSTKID